MAPSVSGKNAEYETSFLTETVAITRVVNEIDCLSDPCAGCAEVQIMDNDLSHNMMAVQAITEVLEKGTHLDGNCTAWNAVHLTDYYVVPSNSQKIMYTNIVYTICDEACWQAFKAFVGSPAFASIPHNIAPYNNSDIYVSDCGTGQRLSGGDLPGCTAIQDCIAQECFFNGTAKCLQCSADHVTTIDLEACVNYTCPERNTSCSTNVNFCGYESLYDSTNVVAAEGPIISVCPSQFCCVSTGGNNALIPFGPCNEVCPTASPSPTNTPSMSPAASTTPTASISPSGTPTPSITPSVSSTPSTTPSETPTPSLSPSATPTPSVTPSVSSTPSTTPSVSSSPSTTPSRTPTPSVTPSGTPTPSISPSQTPSSSASPSETPTSSATPSQTPTSSATPSQTPTSSVSPSETPTPSITPSNTPTPSVTSSQTPTASVTSSQTPTASVTSSQTPTPSASSSSSPLVPVCYDFDIDCGRYCVFGGELFVDIAGSNDCTILTLDSGGNEALMFSTIAVGTFDALTFDNMVMTFVDQQMNSLDNVKTDIIRLNCRTCGISQAVLTSTLANTFLTLTGLEVSDEPNFTSLPADTFAAFPQLTQLTIQFFDKPMNLPVFTVDDGAFASIESTLQILSLINLDIIDTFPVAIRNANLLNILDMRGNNIELLGTVFDNSNNVISEINLSSNTIEDIDPIAFPVDFGGPLPRTLFLNNNFFPPPPFQPSWFLNLCDYTLDIQSTGWDNTGNAQCDELDNDAICPVNCLQTS
eukprot:CFRG7616T1